MRRWDPDDWPPSRPIRVEGGLRARSERGAIGESWWSKRFLAVLESLAMGGRLTRGRSYARAGQVLSLEVSPGVVSAVVQGSRPQPYQVSIGLVPYPESVWQAVETALAGQALFSARLLAGEMPAEIEEVFAAASAPLFPAAAHDLAMRCSCPDWGVPCKHIAATFYLLAEGFDADPFQILHWRGRDRQTLLANLRARRTGAEPATEAPIPGTSSRGAPAGAARSRRTSRKTATSGTTATTRRATTATGEEPAAAVGTAIALADLPAPSRDSLVDRFWLAPVPLPPRPPTLAHGADLLLRQLTAPGPALGGPAMLDDLAELYDRFQPRPEGD